VSELAVFGGCLVAAVLGVPAALFFVESDVLLSQCVVLATVVLYASAAYLLSRRYPLPPAQSSAARLSLPAGVAVGLLLCFALTVVLPVLGSSTREDPLILQLCFSAARQPFVLLDLSVLGPLREELLFRGLMFARLCRLLSPMPAYAASSAVFGRLHSSPDSVKVVECVASGLVLALTYRLTLTLWAPLLVHVLNNSLVAALLTGLSPLCQPSTVERSMRLACSTEDALDDIVHRARTVLGAAEDSEGWRWRTGKQEARVACESLFTALDRGGKGYLDAVEVAFFFSLDETVLDMLSAAFTVLQDDCSATAATAAAQSKLPSAWSSTASMPLPSRSSSARCPALRSRPSLLSTWHSPRRHSLPPTRPPPLLSSRLLPSSSPLSPAASHPPPPHPRLPPLALPSTACTIECALITRCSCECWASSGWE